MKAISKLTFAGLLFAATYTTAQTKPKHPEFVMTDAKGKQTSNMVVRNEAGKVITFNSAIDSCRTGNFKMDKAIDSDKKPYLLLKRAPGFSRPPVAAPVIVRPR